MSSIVIGGLNEEDFRRSIENRLREGRPAAAIERLRPLIAPYARPGGLLPERFVTVEAADLVLTGWEALGEAIQAYDQAGNRVTALNISFGWPGDDAAAPDAQGMLRPHLETSYFSDNAFPFSESSRDDLLEGYSLYGCSWSGDCEASDSVLGLEGIDDLHGALATLEARLLDSEEPDENGIRAGSLGACLLSALLVQAVTERLAKGNLPRPLCVMAGSNGVYPYFDAPVAGMPAPAPAPKAMPAAPMPSEQRVVVEVDFGVPAPRYSSLLMTGIPRAKKRAVLVLQESEDELASRLAKLRGLNHADEVLAEMPQETAPELVSLDWDDPEADAERGGPLLAKKPVRHNSDSGGDSGHGLGLSPENAVPVEPALREAEPPAEPAPLPAPNSHPLGPGFALLEPDLQERLQSLLAGGALPVAEAPRDSEPMVEAQAEPELVEEPVAEVQPDVPVMEPELAQPPYRGLRARIGDAFKAWLSRFGLI